MEALNKFPDTSLKILQFFVITVLLVSKGSLVDKDHTFSPDCKLYMLISLVTHGYQ